MDSRVLNGMRAIVRMLVVRRLSGNEGLITALILRYEKGMRWSDIRHEMNIYESKYSVKASVGIRNVMPSIRDKILSERLSDIMKEIDKVPQLLKDGKCMICDMRVNRGPGATAHFLKKHKDLINEYTEKIMNQLMNSTTITFKPTPDS
ncbi:MAG: hypothetical protein QXM12_03180 [Nitrososphaerota archaeon]